MNRVVYGEDRYYIASVKKSGSRLFVRCLSVSKDGKVLAFPPVIECENESEANKRCRDAVRVKVNRRGYAEVDVADLPDAVFPFLSVALDKQVSPEELTRAVKAYRAERYVVLADVVSLEGHFDAGVQYVGYDYGDDTLEVYDKFGEIRDVHRSRLSSVEKTENALSVMRGELKD